MAFDWKKLLADYAPYILAAGGGLASYQYLGKGKEGYRPYAWAAGGVVTGYLAGKLVSGYLVPTVAPQLPAMVGTPAQLPPGVDPLAYKPDSDKQSVDGLWDLDAAVPPPPRQLTAPRPPAPPVPPAPRQPYPTSEPSQPPGTLEEYKPDVRADDANDWNLLNSMGSFAGSGENGLGSYASGVDDREIDDAIASVKKSKRGRA